MAYQAIPPVESGNFPPAEGADLTDSDQTINPGTDKKSQYVMRAGVMTANRTVTLSNAGSPVNLYVADIIREGTEAFTLTIKRADGTTIFTIPASTALKAECFTNAGNWAFSLAWYL